MRTRIKSTLAGLLSVGIFLAATLVVGQPVHAPATADGLPAAGTLSAQPPESKDALRERLGRVELRGRQTLRFHLSMPYFSFGGLLPRQEA